MFLDWGIQRCFFSIFFLRVFIYCSKVRVRRKVLIFRGGLLLSKCHHVKEKRETKETRKGETRKGETKERELKTRCKHINIPQPGGNKGKKERREKKRSEKKKRKKEEKR